MAIHSVTILDLAQILQTSWYLLEQSARTHRFVLKVKRTMMSEEEARLLLEYIQEIEKHKEVLKKAQAQIHSLSQPSLATITYAKQMTEALKHFNPTEPMGEDAHSVQARGKLREEYIRQHPDEYATPLCDEIPTNIPGITNPDITNIPEQGEQP